jgi:hypothetical protein
MYAAHIGRKALTAYNQAHHPSAPLSGRDFFLRVLWPTVFDHETYLFPPGNSAVGQLVNQKKTGDAGARLSARDRLLEGFAAGLPEGHLFMGGYAADLTKTTSGQITGMELVFPEEEFFYSWIGALCGIGVDGGLWLSFEEPEILLSLVEGWSLYRRYIEETPGLSGNQLSTWNGWWIEHRLGEYYDPADPFAGFSPEMKVAAAGKRLETIRWTSVLFAVARTYPAQRLMTFVNAQGQMNRTYGILPLETPDLTRMEATWAQYFAASQGLSWFHARRLYESARGLHAACEQGALGLAPLRPANLEKLFKTGSPRAAASGAGSSSPPIGSSLGQTWILAMLNDGTIQGRAAAAAQTLYACARSSDGRAKTTNRRMVEQVLEARNRRALVAALTEVLKANPSQALPLQALLDDLFKVSAADFPLLMALIHFKFTALDVA